MIYPKEPWWVNAQIFHRKAEGINALYLNLKKNCFREQIMRKSPYPYG